MMIGMNGISLYAILAFSRRATSMPSILGIITSSRIKSGQTLSTISSAAWPSVAPSTSYPRASRRARRSSILSSWSSTTRMRGFLLRSIVFAEESLDFSDDRPRLAWLGEVSIAADFHRLLAVRREGVRGQRDNWNGLRGRIVLEHLGRVPAIDNGTRDIHQDQIRFFCPSLCYSLLAIQCFRDLIPEVLQNRGIDYTIILVVFHQQYH